MGSKQFHHAEKAWQHNKQGIGRTQTPQVMRKTMRDNVVDIIERFQTHHALQEERELKNFHASENGAVVTRDVEIPRPHVERIVRTIHIGSPASAKTPTPRTEPSAVNSKESSLQIAAFFTNHPILATLIVWLIALIGLFAFFELSIR
jgi:hypothetical protein